jgi:FtsP/CotA-like multicopper oxidase with cupredoxin domain
MTTLAMTRRHFLAAGAALTFGGPGAFAEAADFDIEIARRTLDVNGKAASVYGLTVNGRAGGLFTRYGKDFSARVNNRLMEDTMVHWHGLTPPSAQDGVPHLSGPVLKAGESRNFGFENRRTGTHWMHSHLGLQEQNMLAAPLIVAEDGASLVDEQEHVVMLHDFTFRDPQEILTELQSGGGAHAGHNMAAMSKAEPAMAMVGDIKFDAMLANDRTLNDPEIVRAEKGGKFRLRIINGAAATNMWIDLGALSGELIAVDGNSIRPMKGSRFPLAIAQRADVRLSLPPGAGAYPILFLAEGSPMRSGIVLQTTGGMVTKLDALGEDAPPVDLSMEPSIRSIAEVPDNPVARTDYVMLTGGGGDYQWGFNGKSMMHDTLLTVRQGERYEIIMHNMTGMAHPMHLHGHYFKVVGIDGQRFNGALRDTVLVPVGAQVAIQFDADNPGTWAFHCHHLYHMNSGMMAALSYSSAA